MQLDLVPELVPFVPPAIIIDKPAYSAFFRSPLATLLQEKGVGTVVVTGAETEVCADCVFDRTEQGSRQSRSR